MNWPKVYLKYQRYENFHSCFGAEKSEFSNIPENWWSKRKNKAKVETKKKQIKKRNFKISCFSNLVLNKSSKKLPV